MIFDQKTSDQIFYLAGGIWYDTTHSGPGDFGYYWSITFDTYYLVAWHLNFRSTNLDIGSY